MRVGFARDGIGEVRHAAGMLRGAPSGETRHGEIEAAPEKMDRAALATKFRAEFLEDAVGLQENAPETIRVFGIVGGVFVVLIERNGVLHFVRRRGEVRFDVQLPQSAHNGTIKLRDALRHERNYLQPAVAHEHSQIMRDEIESDFKNARTAWDRRGR